MSRGAARVVAVVGAGLSGLVAAASAAQEGADVVVLEAADQPGGAASWSSGWMWRYRDLASWRTFAPHGDPVVQAKVHREFDDGLEWLVQNGAVFDAESTGRPHTYGVQIKPARLIEGLGELLPEGSIRVATSVTGIARDRSGAGWRLELEERVGHPDSLGRSSFVDVDAVVLAAGGYCADLELVAREVGVEDAVARHWVDRSPGLSAGEPLAAATALGALRSPTTGECATRLVPAGVVPRQVDAARRSLQPGAGGELVDARGHHVPRAEHDWAGAQLSWQLAKTVGDGWYLANTQALEHRGHYGTFGAMLREVERDGAQVLHTESDRMGDRLAGLIGADLDAAARSIASQSTVAIRVAPGFVTSGDGLRIDDFARVLERGSAWLPRRTARPIPGLYAAGADVVSSGLGGIASGLAQGLVLGLAAGRAAAAGL